jgi:hypothetical protein
VLLAGRAQVDVRVDEAREQVAALAVEDLGAGRCIDAPRSGDCGDHAVADEDVVRGVDPGARVEDVGAADEDVRRRGGAEREHQAGCGVGTRAARVSRGAPRPASSS